MTEDVKEAPAEAPVNAQPDQPAQDAETVDTEAAVEEESATSEDDAPRRQNKGVGKRINELTREKYEAMRRAEALEQRLREMEAQAQPQAQTRDKPTLESCNYDPEAFAEAVAEWKIEQTLSNREAQYREAQRRKSLEAKAQEFSNKVAELETLSPGAWERAVNAPIVTTEPMIEVIRESDVGPHIAVWLADNLDEADAIAKMPPFRAAARLGQIEAQIRNGLKSTRATTTKAPPPPPKIAGNSQVEKNPAEMSMKEYVAWRNAQEKRR